SLAGVGVELLGEAEVRDLGDGVRRLRLSVVCRYAASGKKDIRRLEVAVDDTVLMCVIDSLGQRQQQSGGLARRQRSPVDPPRQVAPLDVLQGDERLALVCLWTVDLVNLHD